MRDRKSFLQLCAFMAPILAVLIVYSQTYSFVWDEGFHLLTAQLIDTGKRPYIDFLFPQTPLNAYWNAGWMRILGPSWRFVHVIAAILTAGAALLTADFILVRFPVPRWRLACAVAAALLVGWNVNVVYFATSGQAYAMCLFLSVASFRLSIAAVNRKRARLAAAAGFLAGAAAASSLLTAAIGPVLLIWLLFHNRAGSRVVKIAGFISAAVIPFLPVFWLYAQGPRQVLFNIVQYQALYRGVNWGDTSQQDFEVVTAWIDSPQVLLLGLLALAGLFFIAKRSQWDRVQRAEFYLCGWLALATSAELFTAHPTFGRYFLLTVPFLAVLAAAGLYAIGSRAYDPDRPLVPVLVLGILTFLGLAKAVYNDRDAYSWQKMEQIAAKVEQVTPAAATLWADEPTYFLTRRPPPSGMEFAYSHRLELPAGEAASLHLVSNAEIKKRLAAGEFSTVETCDNTDTIESFNLPRLYAKKADVAECTVFWDKTPK